MRTRDASPTTISCSRRIDNPGDEKLETDNSGSGLEKKFRRRLIPDFLTETGAAMRSLENGDSLLTAPFRPFTTP